MAKDLNNQIDLEVYRVTGKDGRISKVFTGRDRGVDVREKSKINEIEERFQQIKIIIPRDIYSINPSFFEELFVDVVLKLGKEKFYEKFKFESKGSYNYEKSLSEAIYRILRENTAIG